IHSRYSSVFALTSDAGTAEFCLLLFMVVEVILSPARIRRPMTVRYFARSSSMHCLSIRLIHPRRATPRRTIGGQWARLMSPQSSTKHLFVFFFVDSR